MHNKAMGSCNRKFRMNRDGAGSVNTLRPRQSGCHFTDNIPWHWIKPLFRMNIALISFKFVPENDKQALLPIITWNRAQDYLNQRWHRWLTNERVINLSLTLSGIVCAGTLHWGLSIGLGKAQHIDSSLRHVRADWLSCLWSGKNGGLPCHWGNEECDKPSRWFLHVSVFNINILLDSNLFQFIL